jgi:hypothetical protein
LISDLWESARDYKLNTKRMKKFCVILTVLALFIFVLPAKAGPFDFSDDSTGPYLGLEYGQATGLGSSDIRFTTANIIGVALGLLGTICVVLMLYAGFKWMMAGGNEENVKEAQNIIKYAVIGLIIILSAYAITKFVMLNLFKATTGMDYYTVQDKY